MSTEKTNDPSKTPRTPQPEELNSGDLDKVVGGLKKTTGFTRPKSGLTADPCEGGE